MDPEIEKLINSRFGKSRTCQINTVRYANDPEYRARQIAAAKKWNEAHPEAHAKSNKKWAAKNQAAAQQRYRERKKHLQCQRKQVT